MFNFLKEKRYNEIYNYFSNEFFSIEVVDQFENSPFFHLTLNVITIFEDDKIIIKYDKQDSILAFAILAVRCFPSFSENDYNYKYVLVNKLKFYKLKNEEDMFSAMFKDVCATNTIEIFMEKKDITYNKSALVYTSDEYHVELYNLNKELDRWEEFNNISSKFKKKS